MVDVAVPERIARLPHDDLGRPIPWFLMRFDDDRPVDFRFVDADKIGIAIRDGRCWVCGERFQRANGGAPLFTFLVGPLALFNRTTGEPPMHRTCALYTLRSCPFLMTPARRRRTSNLPENRYMPCIPFLDNPGVVVAWMCRRYDVDTLPDGGRLFRLPYPSALYVYAGGLPALRDQLDAALDVAESRARAALVADRTEPADIEATVKGARAMTKARLR